MVLPARWMSTAVHVLSTKFYAYGVTPHLLISLRRNVYVMLAKIITWK